eukprot:UN20467
MYTCPISKLMYPCDRFDMLNIYHHNSRIIDQHPILVSQLIAPFFLNFIRQLSQYILCFLSIIFYYPFSFDNDVSILAL